MNWPRRSRSGPWNNITKKLTSIFPDNDEAVLVSPNRPLDRLEHFLKTCYGMLQNYSMEFSTDLLSDAFREDKLDFWLFDVTLGTF